MSECIFDIRSQLMKWNGESDIPVTTPLIPALVSISDKNTKRLLELLCNKRDTSWLLFQKDMTIYYVPLNQ